MDERVVKFVNFLKKLLRIFFTCMDISPDVWILHVKEILPYERDGGNFFNTDVTLLFRARFAKKKNVTRLLTKISNGCGGKGIVDASWYTGSTDSCLA